MRKHKKSVRMRKRKTRDWMNACGGNSRSQGDVTRLLRQTLQLILASVWESSHGARIKRVHRGINARQRLVEMCGMHRASRKPIIFD